MYATGNKKMLNMLILEILRVYTDEDHSLTQQDIIKLLDKNYGMRYWALQYGPYVEVLEPESLRIQLSEDIRNMSEKYLN
ncbi:WYL domain-containing protein [Lachnospiraceae bacterium XPB1003]|nr:WYL domain-containing protein [Lachnospiraceae bacterium XPB1003]